MATTARLGIDIVGFDKTKTAFAGAERSMASLNRTATQFKAAFAGLGAANLFENFLAGIVRVNAETGPVKAAIDGLGKSYRDFALRVGDAGLNEALINFVNRTREGIGATSGLDTAIGSLLGGAINGMAGLLGEITSKAQAMNSVFTTLSTTVGNFGIDTGIAAEGVRLLYRQLTFAGARELLPGTEDIQNFIDGFNKIGAETQTAGGKTDLLATAMQNLQAPMSNIGMKTDKLTTSLKVQQPAVQKLAEDYRKLGEVPVTLEGLRGPALPFETFTKQIDEFSLSMQDMGSSVIDNMVTPFMAFVSGTQTAADAFASLKASLLSDLSGLTSQFLKSGLMTLFFGTGVSPSQSSGGLFASLFGGARAEGGPVRSGRAYLVGERGPELFMPGSSGNIIPNGRGGGGGGTNVNIYNQAGGQVEQRERRNSDGSMSIDVWFKKKMQQHSHDVNRRAIPTGFGIPPSLTNR